jgi:hypothetical protein
VIEEVRLVLRRIQDLSREMREALETMEDEIASHKEKPFGAADEAAKRLSSGEI